MANKNEIINVAIEFSFPLYTCVPSSAAKERGVGREKRNGKRRKEKESLLSGSLPPFALRLSLSLSSFSLAFSPSPLPPPLPALQNKLPDCPPCPSSANTASAAARKPTSAALAAAFGTEFPLREAAAPATPAQTR